MAQDIYIKINGIDGESLDADHKNEIDVINWSWNIHQEANMHTGSGGGAGKASVEDLEFEHFVDRSSPNLMKYCLTGKHIDEAKLTVLGVPDRPGIAYAILGPIGEANIDVDMIIQNASVDGMTDLITENNQLCFILSILAAVKDDGWIEWHGGRVPPVFDLVDCKLRDGWTWKRINPDRLSWAHNSWGTDIIAYRIAR